MMNWMIDCMLAGWLADNNNNENISDLGAKRSSSFVVVVDDIFENNDKIFPYRSRFMNDEWYYVMEGNGKLPILFTLNMVSRDQNRNKWFI